MPEMAMLVAAVLGGAGLAQLIFASHDLWKARKMVEEARQEAAADVNRPETPTVVAGRPSRREQEKLLRESPVEWVEQARKQALHQWVMEQRLAEHPHMSSSKQWERSEERAELERNGWSIWLEWARDGKVECGPDCDSRPPRPRKFEEVSRRKKVEEVPRFLMMTEEIR